MATIAVLQDRLARQRDLVDQLQHALNSRVTIEQAKGVLATRLDIGTDEAFRLLRDRARDDRRRLRDLAEDVVRTGAEADWSRYHPRA
ncbi:MAG TPA: ANTAR domain-containing protein [Nocardioidaceae bacterium]|nr:ANTAR domain-containing protein [Nocardioidaceae bacterium]